MAISDRSTYLATRYRGSQRWVSRREMTHVEHLLADKVKSVDRILDAPSGHGRFTPLLLPYAREALVCADASEIHLQALATAEESRLDKITLHHCDLYEPLDFPDQSFDLVFNFRFFHHIESDQQRRHVVAELARLSRRFLIVSYYYDAPVHRLQKHLWRRKGHVRKLPMIKTSELRQLFEQQGFEMISDWALFPVIHAHRIAVFKRQ